MRGERCKKETSVRCPQPAVVCGDTGRPVPSLQALKDLGSAASVTLFFHKSDGGLPGRAALRVRAYVHACVRARVHLRRFWKRLCVLSALALRSRSFWVLSCLGWTLFSVFFPSPTATIKKTNPSTMATSYINSQCLCLSLPYHDILGRYWLHKKRRQTNGLPWTVTYAPSAITFKRNL